MKWFQIKEQAAGKKRLLLTWYLYKIFGKNALCLVAFLMSVFTFIFSKSVRNYSKKYLSIIEKYSGIKPTLKNQLKHIHSYADSLADKIIMYCGDYKTDNVVFENQENEKQFFEDIDKGNGAFLICNHVGNIEVLQTFFLNKITKPDFSINIFMSRKQSQIFNDFLETIKVDIPVKQFLVEDIGLETGIEIKEILDNGGVVFIAGDRLAQANDKKSVKATLFSHNISLPKGTFKLAKLMQVPTYFISALKLDGKYKIFLEKQSEITEKNLVDSFTKFLERIILINPFQFFNFFDFFED